MFLLKAVRCSTLKMFSVRSSAYEMVKFSTSASLLTKNNKKSQENDNCTIRNDMKVAVCGCLGKVGKPLTWILKQNPLVSELALYDLRETSGFKMDLSLIDTNSIVGAYCGRKNLENALKGSKIVVIAVNNISKSCKDYRDIFYQNADIVHDLVVTCGSVCQSALLCIVTNPVNSLVPLAVETYKQLGIHGENLILGVTYWNNVQANSITAKALNLSVNDLNIPCIGGANGVTVVPLLSTVPKVYKYDKHMILKIMKTIQGECNLVDFFPHSSAYAISVFLNSLIDGMITHEEINQFCYTKSNIDKIPYLASKVKFGPHGISENYGLPKLNKFEQCLLKSEIETLYDHIELGETYVKHKYWK